MLAFFLEFDSLKERNMCSGLLTPLYFSLLAVMYPSVRVT